MAPGGYAAADAYSRSYKAVQSADFFCGIVPGSVLSQLGKAMNLEGAAGLAMKRLSRDGLAWVPTAGNICTLLAFGTALYLNSYLTGDGSMSGKNHSRTLNAAAAEAEAALLPSSHACMQEMVRLEPAMWNSPQRASGQKPQHACG